jgi:hypothetical protein
MMHLVREVIDQGIQCTAMLARSIIFEAVRELDCVFEISDAVLGTWHGCSSPNRCKLTGSACRPGLQSSPRRQ